MILTAIFLKMTYKGGNPWPICLPEDPFGMFACFFNFHGTCNFFEFQIFQDLDVFRLF